MIGKILNGDMNGFYVKTNEDESTGGYLVLFSKDFDDPDDEGYDEWYPSYQDAKQRIDSMEIEWIN